MEGVGVAIVYVTESVADLVTPPKVATIVAVVLAVTLAVSTVKAAEVFPAGMVTLPGTDAAVWLLEREMTSPPAGAGPEVVMVPAADLPPAAVFGLMEIESNTGAEIVRLAEADELARAAEIAATD